MRIDNTNHHLYLYMVERGMRSHINGDNPQHISPYVFPGIRDFAKLVFKKYKKTRKEVEEFNKNS